MIMSTVLLRILLYFKIFKACQDNPAGHSARSEKTRQTEKEMGGQHPGMDGHDTGCRHEEG